MLILANIVFLNTDFCDLKCAPIPFAFSVLLQVFSMYLIILLNIDIINDFCTVLIKVAEIHM